MGRSLLSTVLVPQTKLLDGALEVGMFTKKALQNFSLQKRISKKILQKVDTEGKGWVNYFAVDLQVCTFSLSVINFIYAFILQGDLRTNVPDDGRNRLPRLPLLNESFFLEGRCFRAEICLLPCVDILFSC